LFKDKEFHRCVVECHSADATEENMGSEFTVGEQAKQENNKQAAGRANSAAANASTFTSLRNIGLLLQD
jgi:hypothetical protein